MAEIGAEAVDGLGAVREVVDMNDAAALHAVAGSAAAQASPHVSPGDAAQIQYTSGTTGFPKGAVLEPSRARQQRALLRGPLRRD